MIIKQVLLKPYTKEEKFRFTCEANVNDYQIKETGSALEAWGYTEEELAQQRKAEFLKDFFKVGTFGYYRRVPKGYQSAVESMNVLFNIANVTNGIQAGLIIFYQEPDFTKPEECTEEWLVAHQIIIPAMTKEEFLQLYVIFMTAWNTEEHEEPSPEPTPEPTEEPTEAPTEEPVEELEDEFFEDSEDEEPTEEPE